MTPCYMVRQASPRKFPNLLSIRWPVKNWARLKRRDDRSEVHVRGGNSLLVQMVSWFLHVPEAIRRLRSPLRTPSKLSDKAFARQLADLVEHFELE